MSELSETLGGYLLEAPMGGAGSPLWRARPIAGGGPVIVCRMDLAHPEQVPVALAEAAPARALHHPNLLRLRDVVTTEAAVLLVHDDAEGGSLTELLESHGRLTPGEVVTALAPIAAALQSAHAAGLVHGQLTPDWILFTETADPMLAGLAAAHLRGGLGPTGRTVRYLDPTMASGGPPSADSDVFMLAAVAVHALTGTPVWDAAEPADALAAARGGDLTGLHARLAEAGVPTGLAEALTRVLTAPAGGRGTAAEFGEALRGGREAAADGTVAAPGPVAGSAPAHGGTSQPAEAGLLGAAPGRPDFPRPAAVAPVMTRAQRRDQERRHRILRPRWGVLVLAALLVAGLTWAVTGGREQSRVNSRTGPIPDGGAAALNPLGGSSEATPAGPAASAAAEPALTAAAAAAVLTQLDALRQRAFALRAPALLGGVYAPGPLLSHDTATLAYLVPAGCGMQGVHTDYRKVSVVSAAADRAIVAATATLTPSVLVCSGAAKGQAPGSGPTALRIMLTRTKTGYLIAGIGS